MATRTDDRLDETNGLTLWKLIEALEDAADEVAFTAAHADELVCQALSDLLEGGLVGRLPRLGDAADVA